MRGLTTALVARVVGGASVALLAIGCGRDPVEPSGTPTPLPPPPATFSISGVVTEAGTAIRDASVGSWVETNTRGGAGGQGRTDAQGRYQIVGLPLDARVWLLVAKRGYIQQCAAGPMVIRTDGTVDLELVSEANLTATSRPSAPGLRTLTGMVGEMTATGLRPMAGIYVGFHLDPSGDLPAAFTYTDSSGRFALCGLPGSEPVSIGAFAGSNRFKFVTVPPGQESGIEIILP